MAKDILEILAKNDIPVEDFVSSTDRLLAFAAVSGDHGLAQDVISRNLELTGAHPLANFEFIVGRVARAMDKAVREIEIGIED